MDVSLGTEFAAIGPVMGGVYPPYNSLGITTKAQATRKFTSRDAHLSCKDPFSFREWALRRRAMDI